MKPYEIYCGTCKMTISKNCLKETLNKATNGMIQIKGQCPICLRWIKWVPYADSVLVKKILNEYYERNK